MSHRGPAWFTCTSAWELSLEVVHLWRVSLEQPASLLQWANMVLSDDEKDRARRFHFDCDRRRFSIARGALRAILGGYLKMDPGTIKFGYGPHGKPLLDVATPPLWFNLSHSHELAIVAVSGRPDLGVDIELLRSLSHDDGTAECAFSPRELEALRSLPAHLRIPGFFACWTRKEAYVKARGGGLSIALDRFDVAADPRDPPTLLSAPEDPLGPSHWAMVELLPAPGYIGTLVAPGQDWRCCYHSWQQDIRSASDVTSGSVLHQGSFPPPLPDHGGKNQQTGWHKD